MKRDLDNEERLYQKTLKRFGLEDKRGTRYKASHKVYEPPRRTTLYSREQVESLDTGAYRGQTLEDQKYKHLVSQQYEIGQAYNKSGFQVLSKRETNEESTGKRR